MTFARRWPPRRWGLAILAALAMSGLLLVVRQPAEGRRAADFTVFYGAALLVREGHSASVYDPTAFTKTLDAVSEHTITPLPFASPLLVTLPFLPLTFLPLEPAFRIWQAANLVLLAATLAVLARFVPLSGRAPAWALLGVLAAAPVWVLVLQGQYLALPLLGAACMVAAAVGDRWALGAAGGMLLALKPHYLPGYLVLLWAERRHRAVTGAIVAGFCVGMSSLLAGGLSGLTGMLDNMLALSRSTEPTLNESWVATLGTVVPVSAARSISVVAYGLSLAALLVVALRLRPAPLAVGALAGWLGILASPHAYPHDLVLLVVPAWLAFGLARRGLLPSPVPALAVTQLALLLDLHGMPITLAPLVMTGVLAVYGQAFRRRAAAPALGQSLAA